MSNSQGIYADVLIVTVTDVESETVLSAFEQATGNKAKTISLDDRVYQDMGMINDTKVFMTLSGMGAGGVGAAQQTVQKGITALHPHAVIMVGIAFGANEQKQAIGDILVSSQLMIYESQRVGADGKTSPRGDRPSASPRLVNYLRNAHLSWHGAAVRFGLILSGEKLVDNLGYRESLQALEPEAIGGEMEGAGLYTACHDAKVDWILVKAICDWADGNKHQDKDARQQQAAQNATDFVVHALQNAPLGRLVRSEKIQVSSLSITEIPSDLIEVLAEEYPDVRDARTLWQRAGGKASDVETITRPRDLWQRLWQRSMQGALARPEKLLQAALEDLPDNAVLQHYLTLLNN